VDDDSGSFLFEQLAEYVLEDRKVGRIVLGEFCGP
jgi:hypothetical protein